MSAAAGASPLLVLGGSFDPVHKGHLHIASALGAALQAREIRLLPNFQSPQRPPPVAAAEQRLEMLRLAAAEPGWTVDDREIRRGGISWTVDTLRELRAEIGSAPLCLALGMDAFALLDRWRDWRRLPDYAHLAVCARAGVAAPTSGPAAELLKERRVSAVEELRLQSSGGVWLSGVEPPDCSANRIRAALAAAGASGTRDAEGAGGARDAEGAEGQSDAEGAQGGESDAEGAQGARDAEGAQGQSAAAGAEGQSAAEGAGGGRDAEGAGDASALDCLTPPVRDYIESRGLYRTGRAPAAAGAGGQSGAKGATGYKESAEGAEGKQ